MTARSATARGTRGRRNAFVLALSAAAVAMSASGGEPRLPGAPGPSGESLKQEYRHDRLDAADAGLRVDLPPALRRGEEATAGTARGTAPLRIGFHREVPKAFQGNLVPRLAWVEMGDGAVAAALLVSSPQAKSIRVALRADLPPGGALRFFHPGGNKQDMLVDPVVTQEELRSLTGAPGEGARGGVPPPAAPKLNNGAHDAEPAKNLEIFWSPSVQGDMIGVEITLPSQAAQERASLRLEKVAHRFVE